MKVSNFIAFLERRGSGWAGTWDNIGREAAEERRKPRVLIGRESEEQRKNPIFVILKTL